MAWATVTHPAEVAGMGFPPRPSTPEPHSIHPLRGVAFGDKWSVAGGWVESSRRGTEAGGGRRAHGDEGGMRLQ